MTACLARVLVALAALAAPPTERGILTMMQRDTIGAGGPAACRQHGYARRYLARDGRIRDDASAVALRSPTRWPCGATVRVTLPRTGRTALAVVVDRGPAGVLCGAGRRLATRGELTTGALPPGCRFAAVADGTAALHRALGGDGYEWVVVTPAWSPNEARRATPVSRTRSRPTRAALARR